MKRRILALFIVMVLTGVTVALKILSSPLVDGYLRTFLVEQAERNLGVRLELGDIDRNTLLTRITFSDVTLKDLRGEARELKARRLTVRLDPYATFRGAVSVRDLTLEGLDILVTRNQDGSVSVDPLFPFWERKPDRPDPVSGTVRLEVGNVTLIDVDLVYLDRPAGINLQLDGVLIRLLRHRFGPHDQREITISARSGELGWHAFPVGKVVAINAIRADLDYSGTALRIQDLAVSSGPVAVRLDGTVPLDPAREMNAQVALSVDLDRLPWLVAGGRGRLDLAGEASGTLISPTFTGRLRGEEISVAGRTFRTVSADIRLDQDGARLDAARINYRQRDLVADIEVDFSRGLPFEADLAITEYPIQSLMEEVKGFQGSVDGDVSARLVLEGRFTDLGQEVPLSATLTGQARVPVWRGSLRTLGFELSGDYQYEEFTVRKLTAGTQTMALEAEGRLAGSGPEIRFEVVEGDLSQWYAEPDGSGSAALSGEIGGSWALPRAVARITVDGAAWRGYTLDEIKAQAELDREGVSLPLMTLRAGTSTAAVQGYVPWRSTAENMFWIVEINRADISDLLKATNREFDATGLVSSHLNLTVTGGQPTARGDVEMEEVAIYGERFEQIVLEGGLKNGRLSFEDIRLIKDGRKIRGEGSVFGDTFQVDLESVDPVDLDGLKILRDLRVFLGGDLDLKVTGEGRLDLTRIQATVDTSWDSITFEGRPWHSGQATFLLEDRALHGRGRLIDEAFEAVVHIDIEPGLAFAGTIRTIDGATVEDLNDLLGIGIPEDLVSGDMETEARARGALSEVLKTDVEGVITHADFSVKGLPFSTASPVEFRYRGDEGLFFPDLRLKNRESVLVGPMRLGPASALEGAVRGEVDFTGFSPLEPVVDSFRGVARLDVKLSGVISDPLIRGYLETENMSCVAHLPFPLTITGMRGRTEVVGDRLHFEDLRGRANGGTLAMEGDLFFSGLNPSQGDLRWTGESVVIDFPEGLKTTNRAQITMRFAEGKGVVRGNLFMEEGKYVRNIDLDNLIAVIGERSDFYGEEGDQEPTGEEGGEWLALDVGMATVNPVDVDIKLVQGQATGNLNLRGTAARPLLVGRFEMQEGTIEYRGHSFEVTYGTVGFFDPQRIEPRFNFSGRTDVSGLDREGKVRDYTVELVAEGVPRKFQLDLLSSPPLSEVDIISLLTWGAVGEQAFATRGGLTATEATLLLTREFKGQLESSVERLTGFDRFVIDPTSLSSSGERTTRIQVDKRLGDNVSLTYSTPVLSSEEQEVTVRYRITENFSLVGEQKGESDYGLDLDFQFEIP